MTIDLTAARDFIYANARLLDRRRLEWSAGGDSTKVLESLRCYRNDDGGFGSALEPDVRGPHSEPTAALHALEIVQEVAALDDPMVGATAAWVDSVALPDGGVPFVTRRTEHYPRGPWMRPTEGGCHLGFGLAATLRGLDVPWVDKGSRWCWAQLESDEPLDEYALKFAVAFLDAIPSAGEDSDRADRAIDRLRGLIDEDGTVPVAGGVDGERLRPLDIFADPRGRGRNLFDDAQVEAALDALEAEQQDDGGWTFDWLAWSPGQTSEWRGLITLRTLRILQAHGRVALEIPARGPGSAGSA